MFAFELEDYFTNSDGILCLKLGNIDLNWINKLNKLFFILLRLTLLKVPLIVLQCIYKLEITLFLIMIVHFELGNYLTNLDEI